jgi:glucosamine--fructose-6-phosphate aminotransferase (isomerizing)
VVVVSRSGERSWVVDALKDAVARGALGVAMTGVADSLLAQHGQITLLTGEGPEITFPKTKSVIACAGLLMRLALALAAPDDAAAAARLAALRAAPAAIRRAVEAAEPQMRELMPFIETHHTLLACGTGSNFGVALEAAVKVQEAAYVTTLCDDTGNVLHGPLGPLNAGWLLMPLVTAYDLTLSRELMGLARKLGGHILSIAGPHLDVQNLSDRCLVLPDEIDPLLAALVYLPPIQMLAYYWAVAKGMNPDEPGFMHAMLETILPPEREEPELRKE